jgi:aminopeptidase N
MSIVLRSSWISLVSIGACVAEPATAPRRATEVDFAPAGDDLETLAEARRDFGEELRARIERGADFSTGTDLYESRRSVLGSLRSELNTPIDVLLYNLDIDFASEAQTYEAEVEILALVTEPTDRVVLDSCAIRTVSEFRDGELIEVHRWDPYTVTSIARGSRELEFEQEKVYPGTLTIELDREARRHELLRLRIAYHGEFNDWDLARDGVLQERRSTAPYTMTFSWPDSARHWLPSIDHPRDPAAWIANVRIDNDLTLLSNGTRIRSRVRTGADGPHTEGTFVMLQPVPTYAFQIVSGNLDEVPLGSVDGVPVSAFMFPEDASLAEGTLGDIPAALEFFNDTFGPYPFDRFSMVELPLSTDGMEHATMVSLSHYTFFPGIETARDTAIHELTHHWFGNNLHQSDWHAFWLNESLAVYATALALGHVDGPDAFDAHLASAREDAIALGLPFSGTLHFPPPDLPPVSSNLSAPYNKGAWIWHMLRAELGDETFFGFLRHFTRTRYFRKYDTPTALAALNEYTGRDFTNFFDEWVYARGYPQIVVEPRYDAATGTVTVDARQIQTISIGTTFELTGNLAVEVELDDTDPATPACAATLEFADGAVTSSTSVPCTFAPTVVRHANIDEILAVVTPAPNPLAACTRFSLGLNRDCGWVDQGSFDCTLGTTFEVGCASECGVGSCTGEAIVRVCEGEEPCASYDTLASNQFACGDCGIATVTCPPSGRYTVLSASWLSVDEHTCTVGTR